MEVALHFYLDLRCVSLPTTSLPHPRHQLVQRSPHLRPQGARLPFLAGRWLDGAVLLHRGHYAVG